MSSIFLVPTERFELPTYGFEDRRSIQLNYVGIILEDRMGLEPMMLVY